VESPRGKIAKQVHTSTVKINGGVRNSSYFNSNSMNSRRVVPVFLMLRVSPASFQMKSPS